MRKLQVEDEEKVKQRKQRRTNTKKQDEDEEKANMEQSLPKDLILEILSRVPGGSLLRFRLVCKLFQSLIDDPAFRDLHLQRAIGNKSAPLRIIALSRKFCMDQQLMNAKITLLDEAMPPRTISTISFDGQRLRLSSSCNGFACIYDEKSHVRLFNLTTREEVFLSEATPPSRRHFSPTCHLGFVPSTKEYKVVRWVPLRDNLLLCEVLTVGGHCWREITYVDHNLYDPRGVANGGAIYFLVSRKTIWSFDLKDEKFSAVPFPKITEDYYVMPALIDIAGTDGSLCLVTQNWSKRTCSMDIWMLKDAASGVWNHRWRVSMQSVLKGKVIYFCSPMFLYKEKLLVCGSGERLYYCNLQSEEANYKLVYEGEGHKTEAHFYVESLISLRDVEDHV